MEINLITTDDFNQFRVELIAEIKDLLISDPHRYPKWVRSADVKKILGVSSSTLQNMRVQGHIPYSKISGITFYPLQDIYHILEQNKVS
jgi:hypothetical protein